LYGFEPEPQTTYPLVQAVELSNFINKLMYTLIIKLSILSKWMSQVCEMIQT